MASTLVCLVFAHPCRLLHRDMHTLINWIIPSGIVVLLKRRRYSMISLVWKRKFIYNNSTGIRSAYKQTYEGDRKESMDCGKENSMFYLTNKVNILS